MSVSIQAFLMYHCTLPAGKSLKIPADGDIFQQRISPRPLRVNLARVGTYRADGTEPGGPPAVRVCTDSRLSTDFVAQNTCSATFQIGRKKRRDIRSNYIRLLPLMASDSAGGLENSLEKWASPSILKEVAAIRAGLFSE